jgi:hypothetical protein
MEPRELNRCKPLLLAVGALFLLLGLWGAADIRNQAHLGVASDATGTITQVDRASPAERGGLRVGDVVKRIDGVDIGNTRALVAMAAGKREQTQNFVVERDGENLTLNATLEALPLRDLVLSLAGALIGWCFLATGLWAFAARPARHTLLLALAGLAMGFGPMPEVDAVPLRLLLNVLTTASGLAGVSLLLHFALVFPRPKPFVEDAVAVTWLYVPAAGACLYISLLLIVRPTMTSGMSRLTGVLMPAVFFLYLAGALAAFLHSYARATGAERTGLRLNLVVAAAVVGFVPSIVSMLAYAIAPRVVLPGGDFYFLTIAAMPLALAWAAVQAQEPAANAEANALSV